MKDKNSKISTYIYLIFILSGTIKPLFLYYDVTLYFDITLVSCLLLIIIIIINNKYSKVIFENGNLVLRSFLLFCIWYLFTLVYSISEIYSISKWFLFTLNIIAFSYPLFVTIDLRLFIRAFVIAILISSCWFLVLYIQYISFASNQFESIIGGSLSLSNLLGIISIILVTSKEKVFSDLGVRIFIVLSLAIIGLLGARGPIIVAYGLIFVYFLYRIICSIQNTVIFNNYIIKNKIRTKSILLIIGVILLLILVNLYFEENISYFVDRSVSRLSLIFSENRGNIDEMGESVTARVILMQSATKYLSDDFVHFLVGYGIGSFGLLFNNVDGRFFPHNIVLEIGVEAGFIGIILLIAFFIQIIMLSTSQKKYISIYVVIYLILFSLHSGSLVDSREMFAFLAMYLLKENEKSNRNILQKNISNVRY